MRNRDGNAVIESSTLSAVGGSTVYGVNTKGPDAVTTIKRSVLVEQSQVRAIGTGGVGVQHLTDDTLIDHSEIAGETSTVDGFNVFIGATRLSGGPVSAGAICAGVYDESFTFYAGPACP